MSPWLVEWLNLLVRWTHVIVGIAWIGASFYFNWLEGRLDRSGNKPPRIAGDLWSVHGGGFYHLQKYEVSPERLPATLHWFKWEAYSTWLTGIVLLAIVYYLQPAGRMLGSNPLGLPGWLAIVISIGTLLGGWLVYHGLCRLRLARQPLVLAVIGVTLLGVLGYGLAVVFDGRAAYIQLGAILGTIMVGNVFFVIIPAQRQMVTAMAQGQSPDPRPGREALQRSLHNNYLTLPVVFTMISNHFPGTYAHAWNWVILLVLGVGSALVRHWFNLRNKALPRRWPLPVAAGLLVALAIALRPAVPEAPVGSPSQVRLWEALRVVDTHCLACHAAQPAHPAYATPPQGLVLETPEQIRRAADLIHARTIATHAMPLGNETRMTDAERQLLGAWLQQSTD